MFGGSDAVVAFGGRSTALRVTAQTWDKVNRGSLHRSLIIQTWDRDNTGHDIGLYYTDLGHGGYG